MHIDVILAFPQNIVFRSVSPPDLGIVAIPLRPTWPSAPPAMFQWFPRASFCLLRAETGIRIRSEVRYQIEDKKPTKPMKTKLEQFRKDNEGKIGWAVLWLLGVPLPVLLIIYLLTGHH